MQPVGPLCKALNEAGYRLTVETNGTMNRPEAYPYIWSVTVSPKQNFDKCKIDWNHVATVKCLWPSTMADPLGFVHLPDTIDKFIQPCSLDYAAGVEKVKEMGWPWRLSIQMHKIIGVP